MKIIVILAVVIGIVAGVGFAVLQDNGDSSSNASSSISSAEPTPDPRKDLPLDVLKALPDEELAEIFPEKAEAILNPESFEQFTTGGKDSDDPEYLRAVLEKMGVSPPADATTKELQELLANASDSTNTTSK